MAIYNGLVTARNSYKNAFAQIDVQLTRRHDLIPNLVETAKGYMKHEREHARSGDPGAQRGGQRAGRRQGRTPATRPRCSSWPAPKRADRQTLGRLFALPRRTRT